MAPARPTRVFLNGRAGDSASGRADAIRAAFAEQGAQVEVEEVAGDQLESAVRSALAGPPRLIVAAGGDGTVRTVASVVAGTEHTLGVLPMGTMNMFARTLGVPLELALAVGVCVHGRDRTIDLCKANDEIVVNNTSAGLYAEMCAARERRREKHKNWPVALRFTVDTIGAFYEVARLWQRMRLRVAIDQHKLKLPSPYFLVSNNEYAGWAQAGRRTDGLLSLIVPTVRTPGKTLWTCLSSAIRGPEDVKGIEVLSGHEIEILGRGQIKIAIDGEVSVARLPLRITCWPDALQVRVPA